MKKSGIYLMLVCSMAAALGGCTKKEMASQTDTEEQMISREETSLSGMEEDCDLVDPFDTDAEQSKDMEAMSEDSPLEQSDKETAAETKPEPKEEPVKEAEPEPKEESKQEPVKEIVPESKEEPKQEPVKETVPESKEEPKQEPVNEAEPEPKDENTIVLPDIAFF